MNELAGPDQISAEVVFDEVNTQLWVVASPQSLPGRDKMVAVSISPQINRMLVRVDGTSIKWFGVMIPRVGGVPSVAAPHVFFTPSPWQGGYNDGGYNDFESWKPLWDKYTSIVGSQIAAAGVRHAVVIPFYKNSQAYNLGSFLQNWREVLRAVISVSIDRIDPLFLRGSFEFDTMFTSSFSNGCVPHQRFNTVGAGVDQTTRVIFDLDGQAGGSTWRPGNGVIYMNTPVAGRAGNPNGGVFHVGGRFGTDFTGSYPGSSTHNLCPFLLMHGASAFGRV